ncbi:MAG: amidohydrolase [Planctomycetota bacterium]|jgi:predicted amidohydrolase YtcJ
MKRSIFATGCLALIFAACLVTGCAAPPPEIQPADLILHNGPILTVDDRDTIADVLAIRDGRIVYVGDEPNAVAYRGPDTRVYDLAGRAVIPGLIDSHVHATGASMTEFDHDIPVMDTIDDVLDYIRQRAAVVEPGRWIVLQQVFITRLEERRYPTRTEMDEAAPRHPVIFRTGPDASLNSRALAQLKIDAGTIAPAGSKIELDDAGQPTGILRGWSGLINMPSAGASPSEGNRRDRLVELMRDYNAVGITSVGDRNVSDSAARLYQSIEEAGDLSVRVALSRSVSNKDSAEEIRANIRRIAEEPLRRDFATNPMLRTIGVKIFLDGGMLTGSAYMNQPWGVSETYSIDDPAYRGLRFIDDRTLKAAITEAATQGIQFTAHSVGDGAVDTLVNAYESVDEHTPVTPIRPCVTHCNFMTPEAIDKMARLGIVADIQPAWLCTPRMAWFQPLATLFEKGVTAGGGSDHMQKIGSFRSVNPYNPFLGMWVAITRSARDFDGALHGHHALSRLQALRFYTANNAYLLFQENDTGSLEPGKLADFVILDRDLLTCHVDAIRDIQPVATYLAGKRVFPLDNR